MYPDDVCSSASPATERARPEVGVGVLSGVTDQRVLAAVRPRALLALESLDGGTGCPATATQTTASWEERGLRRKKRRSLSCSRHADDMQLKPTVIDLRNTNFMRRKIIIHNIPRPFSSYNSVRHNIEENVEDILEKNESA